MTEENVTLYNELQQCNLDIDEKWNKFLHILNNNVENYFLLKEKISNKNRKKLKWYNKTLNTLKKEKDRMYKQWEKWGLFIDKLIFNKVEKFFKLELKKTENNIKKVILNRNGKILISV